MTEYAVIAVLAVICIVLLVALIRDRRNIEASAANAEEYITHGKKTPLSFRDNRFARLHNDICDLEQMIENETANRQTENRQNADFVADVSHQLKTPLAGLRLYCEMQEDVSPSEYTEKELELIDKMEKLVKNLLRLEKIRSDAYEMEMTDNDIGVILGGLAEDFKVMFPEKNISAAGNAALRCDKNWLAEAVGNVIKNACEHTADNGTVNITAEKSGTVVSITVEDDGGGVNPEELPKLFGRFYKSENSSAESTGIGLAICRAITEKHHDSVFAENGRKGLKITMCFPVIEGNKKI